MASAWFGAALRPLFNFASQLIPSPWAIVVIHVGAAVIERSITAANEKGRRGAAPCGPSEEREVRSLQKIAGANEAILLPYLLNSAFEPSRIWTPFRLISTVARTTWNTGRIQTLHLYFRVERMPSSYSKLGFHPTNP